MTKKVLLSAVSGAMLLLASFANTASAQVSCSGLPTFASCTAYASGTSVVFNNTKYTAIAAIASTRDCPPNSPYDPTSDNWWTNNGTCTSTSTATATATKTNTATATRTPTATATTARATATATTRATATATTGSTSTATATRTSTPTATRTNTATATSSGAGCATAWVSTTAYNGGTTVSRTCGSTTSNYTSAYWTQGNDPCTSSGAAGSGQPWGPPTACGGGATATATATATRTSTATATTGGSTATATATKTPTATTGATATATSSGGGGNNMGAYFAQWGIYSRAYYVKNIDTSGSAAKLNVIHYAFNNIISNKCSLGVSQAGVGDAFADYGKSFDAATSVDGVADTWADASGNPYMKGNWNQLKKLKAKNPNLKVVIALGGWTWSDGFYSAATSANRVAFVASCVDAYIKGNLPLDSGDNAGGPGTAAGLFDGIDLDWEYPGICGNNPSCGASSADKANLTGLVQEFRKQMDAAKPGLLLTAAVGAGSDKMPNYDGVGLNGSLNYVDVMTYDFFGAWAASGPTAPHSPLYAFKGQSGMAAPQPNYNSDAAIQAWISAGVSASKIKLGYPAYGRGWTGVGSTNGGLMQSATGAATGTYEAGIEDYKVLVGSCPSTGVVPDASGGTSPGAGTAMALCGSNWWSYDTPGTIATKMGYVKSKGLGGAFLWSLDGDTSTAAILGAARTNLP